MNSSSPRGSPCSRLSVEYNSPIANNDRDLECIAQALQKHICEIKFPFLYKQSLSSFSRLCQDQFPILSSVLIDNKKPDELYPMIAHFFRQRRQGILIAKRFIIHLQVSAKWKFRKDILNEIMLDFLIRDLDTMNKEVVIQDCLECNQPLQY